ncbi:MAG: hypothetical protein Q8M29_05830 [Bacteroidota bacterium]|nr:hypothetical protein [Bacteroidota bacterium]
MKKIKVYLVVCLFFCLKISSQVDLNFVKHLSSNGLKNEHVSYLTSSTTSSDSLHYLTCKYYLQYHDDSLFFEHLYSSVDLSSRDCLLVNAATVYYFKQSDQYTRKWIEFVDQNVDSTRRSKQFVTILKQADSGAFEFVSLQLDSDMRNYKKALKKKPLLAATMSAVVPGLGKAYIGRKRAFGITLAAHLLYGVQTYESIKRLGIKNPVSIFNIGMLGLMYSANIYGSFIETKKNKKEKYHQLLNHGSDYLYMDTGNSLYP